MNTDSLLCVTLRGGGTISSDEFLRWKSASTNIAFMSTSDMSSAAAPSTRHPCDERSDMICCSRTQPVACYSVLCQRLFGYTENSLKVSTRSPAMSYWSSRIFT